MKKVLVIILLIAVICVSSGAFAIISNYALENTNDSENNGLVNDIEDMSFSESFLNNIKNDNIMDGFKDYWQYKFGYLVNVDDELRHYINDNGAYYLESEGILDRYIQCVDCAGFIPIGKITNPLPKAAICHHNDMSGLDFSEAIKYSYARDEAYNMWVYEGMPVYDDEHFNTRPSPPMIHTIYCENCHGIVILKNYDDSWVDSYLNIGITPITSLSIPNVSCSHYNGSLDLLNTPIEDFYSGWFRSIGDYNQFMYNAIHSLNDNSASLENKTLNDMSLKKWYYVGSAPKNFSYDEYKSLNDNSSDNIGVISDIESEGILDRYIQCAECGGFIPIGKITNPLPKAAICHHNDMSRLDFSEAIKYSYTRDEAYYWWVYGAMPAENFSYAEYKSLNDNSSDNIGVISDIESEGILDRYIQCAECGGFMPIGKITNPLPKAAICHHNNISGLDFSEAIKYSRTRDEVYNLWVYHGMPVYDDEHFNTHPIPPMIDTIYCENCHGIVILKNYDDSWVDSYLNIGITPITSLSIPNVSCSHYNGSLDLLNTPIEDFHSGWFNSIDHYNQFMYKVIHSLNDNSTGLENKTLNDISLEKWNHIWYAPENFSYAEYKSLNDNSSDNIGVISDMDYETNVQKENVLENRSIE